MLQFTSDELKTLRCKAQRFPNAIASLEQACAEVLALPVQVPTSGVGNWFMYYVCPDCSLTLQFDRRKPHTHRCPGCGKVYTGEPYDGSWWGQVNHDNAQAAWQLALLWQLTGKAVYAEKATALLLEYARHYPDYEPHGNIPYNGPGRANAQTLDESLFLRGLARAADLLEDILTDEQKALLCRNLWRPGADFLRQNRHDQIHNHEVICDSAIAALGLLLQDSDLLDFAVYQKYGIRYQLEHGVQADGRWFEGCFGYQFFALESFVEFEIMARHTPYSQMQHPNYGKMLESIYDYLTPEQNFPLENDWHRNHRGVDELEIYEFFYKVFPTDKIATMLNFAYRSRPRDNLFAFLYGPETLPPAQPWIPHNYHDSNGVGNVVLHGAGGRYLELKCGSFGGEHDHYDKLGISYMAAARPVSADLGTCSYGAPLHYAYFKNTATHNTVNLGGKNQPPCCGKLLHYEETSDGFVFVDAAADWNNPGPLPDSFVLCQWDKAAYRGAWMYRQLAWCDEFYADVFTVDAPGGEPILWSQHFKGTRTPLPDEKPQPLPCTEGPLWYLTGSSTTQQSGKTIYTDAGLTTMVYAFPEDGTQTYYATGPDYPSVNRLCYQIEAAKGTHAQFIHLVASYQNNELPIQSVECHRTNHAILLTVEWTSHGTRRCRELHFPLPVRPTAAGENHEKEYAL